MTRKNIVVDIGSSTIKVYEVIDGRLHALATRSIALKSGFDPRAGISDDHEIEIFELIDAIKKENPDARIKVLGTALFRKLERYAHFNLIDKFYQRTGLFFNIISQEIESFYLQMALGDKASLNEPVLLINIGGGSTELVVMYGDEAIEKINTDIGVATVINKFHNINEQISGTALDEIVEFIKRILPSISNNPKVAFYNGGELSYMRLAAYPIEKNKLFEDTDHPSVIRTKNFSEHNAEIFRGITLEFLESKMPNDPKWMHGARACSAIAQAICEKYGIETIIPSDSNTAHGMVRHEFRYVTISGSFRKHLDYILKIKNRLESIGTIVLSPRFTEPKNPGETFVVFTGEEGKSPLELERHHLNSIERSDALIVCSPNGYVGASALIEIGYAQSLGKKIVFTEKPEEFMLNTLPAQIGL